MANEISGFVIASSTGNYALVVNPANKAQAWDTLAGAWATKNPADADQQIALGSGISEGAGYETQYANLPAGLDASEEYEVWLYDSSNNWIGNKLYRGSSVSDSLAAIAVTDAVVDSINAKLGTPAVDIAADIAAIETGDTQPRINYPPTWRLPVGNRNAGEYRCVRPIRLRPGAIDTDKCVGLDMSGLFGDVQVETVGTPTVSSGSITATALGPRDQLAMVQLGGVATASEVVTVDVAISMDNGDRALVTFEIQVAAS